MSVYRNKVNNSDPQVHVTLPIELYEDLCGKALESGRTLETEVRIRLARSLPSKDLDRIEAMMLSTIFHPDDGMGKAG